jgi:hypothetical protein
VSQNPPAIHPVKVRERARPARVDWFRVIVNLERNECPQRDVAAALGMSQSWVHHLKNSPGAEPRFDDGNALLDLWCEVMDKPLCDVPRERAGIYG